MIDSAIVVFAVLSFIAIIFILVPSEYTKKWHAKEGAMWIAAVLWLILVTFVAARSESLLTSVQQFASLTFIMISFLWAVRSARRAANAEERARDADNKAKKIQDDLVESQNIVLNCEDSFNKILEKHFIEKLALINNPRSSVYLYLSTPIFGYHPLDCASYIQFKENLSRIASQTEATIEIILFIPDDHYFHWLNTLLWENIKIPDDFMSGQRRVYPRATGIQYAELLKGSLIEFQSHKDSYKIWACRGSNIRMIALKGQSKEHKEVQFEYLVLTDNVAISTDLKYFSGRSIPVQSLLHKEFAGEIDSYFEHLKICPFSLKNEPIQFNYMGNDQLEFLIEDYILGRTENTLVEFTAFKKQIENLIIRMDREKYSIKFDELGPQLIYSLIGFWNRMGQWNGSNKIRLTAKETELATLAENISTVLANVKPSEFKFESANESYKKFIAELKKSPIFSSWNETDAFSPEKLSSFIYHFVSSGFGESKYAKSRKEP